jgi:hypothetical protein
MGRIEPAPRRLEHREDEHAHDETRAIDAGWAVRLADCAHVQFDRACL